MSLEIVLLAITILIMLWTLERIFAKLQSVERHVKGMRNRLNALEHRVVSNSRVQLNEQSANVYQASVQKPTSKTIIMAVCGHCGTEFDANLDRCPKCKRENIDKTNYA
jgi:predicted Zn-ribbon and HTH transcriptional regulator